MRLTYLRAVTWWAQKLYDHGHVSLDWALQNARQPNAIIVKENNAGPSSFAQPASPTNALAFKHVGELIVHHPTPEKAMPCQPPFTEPARREALVLSAQEKETIQLLCQHEEQKLRGIMKILTSVVPSPKCGTVLKSTNMVKGKGKAKAD